MKKLLLVLPLLCLTPSCETLRAALAVPAAVVSDVGGVVDTTVGAVEPSPAAKAAGEVASTGATILTGNAALGAGVGVIVTGLVTFLLSKKKRPAS